MRELFLRKLKMYSAVFAVLKNWMGSWANMPGFTEDYNALGKFISDINAKDQVVKDSLLVSEEKKQRFSDMIDLALEVCGAGSAYANKIKDHALALSFDFTRTSLEAGNDTVVCARCRDIAEAAQPIQEALVNYNLPIGQADMLLTAIAAAESLIAAPHVAIKGRKSILVELDQLYDDCDSLLRRQLDREMLTFARSQPGFYTEYTTAREIGGWGSGGTKDTGGEVKKEGK